MISGMIKKYKDRVVLITGASSGIGRELALQAAKGGARLALVARREDRLDDTGKLCQDNGARDVLLVPLDLAEKENCYEAVNKTISRYSALDVLINNAGFAVSSELDNLPDTQPFEQVMDVNFRASMWLTHASLPHLIRSKGTICGISSVAGLFSMRGSSIYNASKFAMRGFFDALRQELKPKKVTVTMIYPGYVVTEFKARVQNAEGQERGQAALNFYKSHMMSAERCATIIHKAILTRKRQVVMTFATNAARWLQLMFPGLIDWVISRKAQSDKKDTSDADG